MYVRTHIYPVLVLLKSLTSRSLSHLQGECNMYTLMGTSVYIAVTLTGEANV
jgi:hypothetical protein